MYKVLLVDDEKNIVRGMRTIINWEDYGCVVCGVAYNGEEGVKKIKEECPDIIITDIKMKVMTGLDMLEQAADYTRETKTIIMTGYRDFEYAHKAISLGVSAFVLKPVDLDELQRVIAQAVDDLRKNDAIKDKLGLIKDKINKEEHAPKKQPIDMDYYKAEESGSGIEKNLYNEDIGAFVVLAFNVPMVLNDDIKPEINEVFHSMLGDIYTIYILSAAVDNELTVIISSDTQDKLEYDMLYPMIENIRKSFESTFSEKISIGVSNIGRYGKEIKIKYFESKQALEHKLYTNSTATMFYKDIQNISYDVDSTYNTCCEALVNAILTGNMKTTDKKADELKIYIDSIEDERDVKNLCIKMIMNIYELYKTINGNFDIEESRKTILSIIEKCESRDEITELVTELSRNITKKFYDYNNTLFGKKLKKAITYISDNYSQLITRDDIAKNIGVTPGYVSVLFRKGMDSTLMEYITKVRINEAKKLLCETEYKVYEIAEQVGFEDAFYFSKIFKNTTGMSPKEWRIKNTQN